MARALTERLRDDLVHFHSQNNYHVQNHLVHTELGIHAGYLFAGLHDTPDSAIDPSFIHILWEQFDKLFERPLFSRSWIVQEIVLARNITIQCGTLAFPLHIFNLALGTTSHHRASSDFKPKTPLKSCALNFASYWLLRRHLRKKDKEIPLFHFASHFGQLLATDPRDKIYAFLSLSSDLVQKGIFIDSG